ncbi:MAG TPA: hypothetical protein VI316_11805 [Candidatus Dormibacteraeota bacterium]
MSNLVPRRYREVSLTRVDEPLTEAGLHRHFMGREAYRRTRYVIAQRGTEMALVEVGTEARSPLFSPISAVTVLALPDECALIHDPDVDTDVPSQLARVATEQALGVRCVAVHGRYEHVSFILDPDPHEIRVVEVVPPHPPKLLDQAQRVIDSAPDLPPLRLVPVLVDLGKLARDAGAEHYLLPCRGSGITTGDVPVSFLDERPPRQDWLLIGCARSREIHRWFYGSCPPNVDMCPRVLAQAHADAPSLTKCCLLEENVDGDGPQVTVPWGSSLDTVREGLDRLVRTMEWTWAPA